MQVTTLLISHNGARWLPAVLHGVASQTRRPDALIALDTGSTDTSADLIRADGRWHLDELPATTSFVEAVHAALPDVTTDWVWLLHDDANPDPAALARLCEAAAAHPDVSILGPKLREWPSLRRLLELGVTISGTGRRETGLERGEYDQGQHDQSETALAVNTAGMLVRRDVLADLGLDPALPLFGNDIDLGWRAALAGHRTLVVPEAVVFHAEAATRGQRSGQSAEHRHRRQREAALYTLLANGSGRGTPWRMVRLFFGSLVRALGFLLVRAPREAGAELAAVASVLGRPWRIAGARAARRVVRSASTPATRAATAALLAPTWLPYRHGLDFVGDFLSALLNLGRDSARSSTLDPLAEEDDLTRDQPGLLSLLVRNRLFWLVVGGSVLSLLAARGNIGGHLWGGSLLPAPDSAAVWWQRYWSGSHTLGVGTSAPAPAYLLPLAAAGWVLGNHPGWVTAALFLFSVPLTALSALRFFRALVGPSPVSYWGAIAYALLPVATGAVADGRLGTVAGAFLLPWVATSALHLLGQDVDRRWRAAWRTSLGGALLTAFVPVAYLLACVAVLALLVGGALSRSALLRGRDRVAPLLTVLVAVPALLLPWIAGVGGAWSAWLVEAGRADLPWNTPTVRDALAGHPTGGTGASWALTIPILIVATLALLRGDRQRGVRAAWVTALLGALGAAVLALIPLRLPGLPTAATAWPGFLLLVSYTGLICAAVLAGDGLREWVRSTGFSWRQPVALGGSVLAGLSVIAMAGWWVWSGFPGPVAEQPLSGVPAYMSDLAVDRENSGVLVLTGDARDGVSYRVLRHGPWRVGDDAIAALTQPDPALTDLVGALFSPRASAASTSLADYGLAYIYVPVPARPAITGALDASTSLSRASAARARDAAWRIQAPGNLNRVHREAQPWRRTLVGLELFAIVVVIVLAAPTRRRDL